jgi:hypothetical protein
MWRVGRRSTEQEEKAEDVIADDASVSDAESIEF